MSGIEDQTLAREAIFPKLEPKDQQLLQKLEDCQQCCDKTQKLQRLLELLELDKTQTTLKSLAFRADSQTAFNFILWVINGGLVELDWIYDVAYKISTDQSRQDVKIENIYKKSYKLTSDELTRVLAQTQALLTSIRLEDFDIRDLVNSLEQALLISLLTSFLSFQKIGMVDLNNIAEIAKSFAPPTAINPQTATTSESAPAEEAVTVATKLSATTSPKPSEALPESGLGGGFSLTDDTLEDILIAFNLRHGGSETQILRRTLDNFLFMKSNDRTTGSEQIVYKPGSHALQYCFEGQQQQLLPVPISSSQTWGAGVYLLQRGAASVKVMRLPGNNFFEIFPEGPDPYLRVITINSTLRERSSER